LFFFAVHPGTSGQGTEGAIDGTGLDVQAEVKMLLAPVAKGRWRQMVGACTYYTHCLMNLNKFFKDLQKANNWVSVTPTPWLLTNSSGLMSSR
jgi:hypothetical protein